MKAVVYQKYGSPDALELKEVEQPLPADDQVLIKVHAVSINDWDYDLLRGAQPRFWGLLKPKFRILGSDIAGRVEGVGRKVTRFRVGDEVFGDLSGSWGGFAEYVCADENALELKPTNMTFAEAAAVPQAGLLALQGLFYKERDKGQIRPGQNLLINGAGGGVGTFAVQIARQYGARITGVDSAGKLEMLRAMGCDRVIDYAREDFTRNGQQYDLILDVKSNRSIFDYARALTPGGVYVTVGGSIPRLLQLLLLAPWVSSTRNRRIRILALKPNQGLKDLRALIEAGELRSVIDRCYPLAEVPEAFRYFARSVHKGKVVITME